MLLSLEIIQYCQDPNFMKVVSKHTLIIFCENNCAYIQKHYQVIKSQEMRIGAHNACTVTMGKMVQRMSIGAHNACTVTMEKMVQGMSIGAHNACTVTMGKMIQMLSMRSAQA